MSDDDMADELIDDFYRRVSLINKEAAKYRKIRSQFAKMNVPAGVRAL